MKIVTLLNKLYHVSFIESFMHTLVYELKGHLKDCESVLDLGCGPSSPIQYCPWIKRSIGVEAFEPYLEKSMTNKIHAECVKSYLQTFDFPKKVLMQ